MKAEIIKALSVEQIERAYAAYSVLAVIYEDVCQGPRNARAYREYFGIMDTRENLRKRFMELQRESYGTDAQ